jgi:uncharacterized protein YndB with AHSA1/START domain
MKVSTSMVIGAPPTEVFALLSDPAAVARVAQPQAELVDDRTGADGVRHVSLRLTRSSGSTTERTMVVTEAIPNERIVTQAASRTLHEGQAIETGTKTERVTMLSPHPEGTLVEADTELRIKPACLGILIGLFFRRRVQREFDSTMAAVRDHFLIPRTK